MQGETKDKWMKLCEQAAVEQDPQKLLDLVQRINDLLEAKERRLGIDTTPRPPRSSMDEERESESVA